MSFARCKALLDWYGLNARRLPWRDTDAPYAIWISEIMLQQTQVKTVLVRYADWFERFPSIEALAAASLDDVLKAWEGLGYYRRARFIHQAAGLIVEQHRGIFPSNFDAIMALPGIGLSTAGAIASFCFAANTPVLDANVKRVLRRWHGMPEAADNVLWPLAQQAIDSSAAIAIWNQSMMELGATLCTAKSANCGDCPVNVYCDSAFRVEIAKESRKKTAVRDVHWQVHLHRDRCKGIWLSQRPVSGIWAGLWTPPITELAQAPACQPDHIHLLTHRRLHLYVQHQTKQPSGAGIWVSSLEKHALPTGIHRLLALVSHK
ncbi:MAG: A/G-specific adenine glycosylase [Mariprofundus sp.]|nr:A/G-specific adenine glycosylase [Mariprofundus sp.]